MTDSREKPVRLLNLLESEIEFKLRLLRILLVVGLPFSIYYAWLALGMGYHINAACNAVISVIFTVGFITSFRTVSTKKRIRHIRLFSYAYFVCLAMLHARLALDSAMEYYFWFLLFPILAFLVLGHRHGRYVVAAYSLMILACLWLSGDMADRRIPYESFRIQVAVCILFAAILGYVFERVRSRTHERLIAQQERLVRSEEALASLNRNLREQVRQRTDSLTRANEELTREISIRRASEQALVRSEQKYRAILESMKDAAYICSADRRIQYLNPGMIRKLGRDATGEFCHNVFCNQARPCGNCIMDQVLAGEYVDYDWTDPADGRHYSVANSPICHIDGQVSKLSIFRDITDIKQMEARVHQARKMESIGTMAAGIAHDFNNILYMITGNAELAMAGIPESNPVHAHLRSIKTAGLKAAGIIKQLLHFSRKADPEMRPVPVNPLINEAAEYFRTAIPVSVDLRLHLPERAMRIKADPMQIQQVLINLCTNAVQAMEENGGVLEIRVAPDTAAGTPGTVPPELPPGDYVRIRVSDTGTGMTPDMLIRIFDPYYTTRRVGQGAGMGLAVVQGIVKKHNGAVSVDSETGRGSTFSVWLPRLPA